LNGNLKKINQLYKLIVKRYIRKMFILLNTQRISIKDYRQNTSSFTLKSILTATVRKTNWICTVIWLLAVKTNRTR